MISVFYFYNLPRIVEEMFNSMEYKTSATARVISVIDSKTKPGYIEVKLRYYNNKKQYFSTIFEPGDTRSSNVKLTWKVQSKKSVLVSNKDPKKIILNESLSLVQAMTLTFIAVPFIFGFFCALIEFILARDAMEISIAGVTIGKYFNITFFMTGVGVVIYIPLAWSTSHPFNWMVGVAYLVIVLPVSWAIIFINHHRKNKIKASENQNCFLPDYKGDSESADNSAE